MNEQEEHKYKMCIELAYNQLVSEQQINFFALGALLYTIVLN